MSTNNFDIITGIHSVACALQNSERKNKTLYVTDESLKALEKELNTRIQNLSGDSPEDEIEVQVLSTHSLQDRAKNICQSEGFQYSRFPSNLFLVTTKMEAKDLNWLYDKIVSNEVTKIIALDKVTDAHNGAAIMRTAAFYGVDAIIVASRGGFGETPGFFRISSGASEFVPIVKASSLPKVIGKLKDMGVYCLGLSEHATKEVKDLDLEKKPFKCLVMGAEDTGLGNAVSRQVDDIIALESMGPIKSLNVSVASAIAMERVFSEK